MTKPPSPPPPAHPVSPVYGALWLLWIAMFAAIEFTALGSGRPQDTLSEFVWRIEQLGTPFTFARYLVAALCIWLAGHFILGWWR
jgi:hypothetical protein